MTAPEPQTRCPYTFRPLADPSSTVSEHVDRVLPDNWGDSVTLCVALAGARASGKSLYVAVLVKLLEQLAEELGRVVLPADQSTAERYQVYYEEPFFEEMGLLASTPPMLSPDAYQRDPLIFDLGRWPVGGQEDRQVFLALRDVAGEDLENLPEDRSQLEFFQHAHQIVFMFDPVTVPEIETLLHGSVPTEGLGADPSLVLQNLLTVIGTAGPKLAIALSKFDTLRKLENFQNRDWGEIIGNYGAAFNRQLEPLYSGSDPYLLSMEVRSLLVRLDAKRLLNLLNSSPGQPLEVRYFATSSLGGQPHGSHLLRSGIAPFRCLDPLLWLLYEYNIMRGN